MTAAMETLNTNALAESDALGDAGAPLVDFGDPGPVFLEEK
jgi:hypothetical protein